MTTLEDAIRFILRGNCPDCFHPECLRRADLAWELRRIETEDPVTT